MQIDRVFYPTKTLGYGNRVSIWTIGCPRRCKGCSNPELWLPNKDKNIDVQIVCNQIQQIKNVDGITITGGDPFFQFEELLELLTLIKRFFTGDILVYTGYTLEELIASGESYINSLKLIDVLIDGPYIESLNDNTGIIGSTNQNIHLLSDLGKTRYSNVHNWPRKSQPVICDGKIINIGIPIKEKK